MIDTVKFKIPYTEQLAKDIYKVGVNVNLSFDSANDRQSRYQYFRGYKKLGSYDRNVNLFINTHQETIFLELSLPKFVFGHNVFMLYPQEVEMVVYRLWAELNRTYKTKFPTPEKWELYRLDLCYSWKLSSQSDAQAVLNRIKTFKFPYKRKETYRTGVFHKGGRLHSVKFYLKQPEFMKHDFKALKENPRTIEKAYNFSSWSEGVLRFEVTLKRRYLLREFPSYERTYHTATRYGKMSSILGEFLSSAMSLGSVEFMSIEDARERLDSFYSKRTANHLMQYWLLLQRYDNAELENILGLDRSSIYRRNKKLDDANMGLLQSGGNKELKLNIPSEYSTNPPLLSPDGRGSVVGGTADTNPSGI